MGAVNPDAGLLLHETRQKNMLLFYEAKLYQLAFFVEMLYFGELKYH